MSRKKPNYKVTVKTTDNLEEKVDLSSLILFYANQLVELSDKNIDMDEYISQISTSVAP